MRKRWPQGCVTPTLQGQIFTPRLDDARSGISAIRPGVGRWYFGELEQEFRVFDLCNFGRGSLCHQPVMKRVRRIGAARRQNLGLDGAVRFRREGCGLGSHQRRPLKRHPPRRRQLRPR